MLEDTLKSTEVEVLTKVQGLFVFLARIACEINCNFLHLYRNLIDILSRVITRRNINPIYENPGG